MELDALLQASRDSSTEKLLKLFCIREMWDKPTEERPDFIALTGEWMAE